MSVAERREREREQRRDWILDAATRVFYAKGMDAAKMKDVAEEAQLGKGTLYLYFRTKEELILGVAVRHQQQLIARFAALQAEATDGADLLRSLVLAYARKMSEPREHLRMAMCRWATGEPLDMESRGGEAMRQNLRLLFATLCGAVERGKADGSIRAELHTPRTAISLLAAVDGALLMQLKQACFELKAVFPDGSPPSVEEAIELYLRSVTTGKARLAAVVGAD